MSTGATPGRIPAGRPGRDPDQDGRPGLVDLVTTALAAAIAAPTTIYGGGAVAVLAGLLLALFLPGHALVRAAIGPGRLSTVEHAVLAPATSLGTLVLGGLGLFAARVRLDTWSWALLTSSVTVLAALVAWLRQPLGSRPTAGRPSARRKRPTRPTLRGLPATLRGLPATLRGLPATLRGIPATLRGIPATFHAWLAVFHARATARVVLRWVPLAAVVALLASAAVVSMRSTHRQAATPFTALSLTTLAAGRPQAFSVAHGQPSVVRRIVVDVSNQERGCMAYLVVTSTPTGYRSTIPVSLRRGATRSITLSVPADTTVRVDILRATDSSPYRSVLLAGVTP